MPRDPRILVVDDVADNRDLLIRRLQQLGLRSFDQAEDGMQAVAAIMANAYDLVLLDIMMPGMDGFGVLKTLNRAGRFGDLPIIVVSALDDLAAVVQCIELGADDFIFKPINSTLLRARVTAVLDKKHLRDQIKQNLALKQRELNEARALQMSLVPLPFAGALAGRRFRVDVMLEPAREVGGDLVDAFSIGDDMLVLAIGDVSDKGAGSALMMARAHATLRALADRPDAIDLFSAPSRAIGALNRALSDGNTNCMFVTFWLGSLNMVSGVLTSVRAGHIPPFHGRGGSVSRLAELSGLPLGLDADAVYLTDEVTLRPGDRLLVLTDGVTEAMDASGAPYGDERVAAFVSAIDMTDALTRLRADVRAFEGDQMPSDDIAAVLLVLED